MPFPHPVLRVAAFIAVLAGGSPKAAEQLSAELTGALDAIADTGGGSVAEAQAMSRAIAVVRPMKSPPTVADSARNDAARGDALERSFTRGAALDLEATHREELRKHFSTIIVVVDEQYPSHP